MDACIYLSSSRGITENSHYRSHHTFNFGGYHSPDRTRFGKLIAVNDETLAAGENVVHTFTTPSTIVVIPLVGDVTVAFNEDRVELTVGQAYALQVKGGNVTLTNPYTSELINYLFIVLEALPAFDRTLGEFQIDQHRNKLIPVFLPSIAPGIYIGQFDGRQDAVFRPTSGNQVFSFVIEGAFEVQNRLLHPRDGLALSAIDEIEFEALSNEAILLMIVV